jgi:predicted nucleic acid-binding protein
MPETKRSRSVSTAFWDTSAIVPLCCHQTMSAKARQVARTYSRQIVWWVTSVEVVSAFQRLIREGHISRQESAQSLARLEHLRSRWNEVQPSAELRIQAEQLLRMQPLRAADALQLAAALIWCNNRPRGHTFIVADKTLADAAQIEGFSVTRL